MRWRRFCSRSASGSIDEAGDCDAPIASLSFPPGRAILLRSLADQRQGLDPQGRVDRPATLSACSE